MLPTLLTADHGAGFTLPSPDGPRAPPPGACRTSSAHGRARHRPEPGRAASLPAGTLGRRLQGRRARAVGGGGSPAAPGHQVPRWDRAGPTRERRRGRLLLPRKTRRRHRGSRLHCHRRDRREPGAPVRAAREPADGAPRPSRGVLRGDGAGRGCERRSSCCRKAGLNFGREWGSWGKRVGVALAGGRRAATQVRGALGGERSPSTRRRGKGDAPV